MILSWFRNRRRRALLAEPFPTAWLPHLDANVGHYALLPSADRDTLRDMLRIFIAEKDWEGCGGLVITDEMRVTIAAQACIPILRLGQDSYAEVTSVLVYPEGFKVPCRRTDGLTVTDEDEERLGEAHVRGPVVLAWEDVLDTGRNPGRGENLVYHEFAHQLDYLDGTIDGTPPLPSAGAYQAWSAGMGAAFAGAQHAGRRNYFGSYAATNEGEFFAVATERFFDDPHGLESRHPTVYALLRTYFQLDPLEWKRETP